MKIGIDCRMLLIRPTGIGQYIFNLVRNLMNIDRSNEYILYANNEILADIVNNFQNFRLKIVNIIPLSLKEQFSFNKIIKDDKLDLIHIPSFSIPMDINLKTVVTIHDLIHLKFKKEFSKIIPLYYNLIVKRGLKKSNAIITDSDNSKNDILKWINLPEEKIRKIHLGISNSFHLEEDNNKVIYIKNKFGIKKNFILYHGSKKPHKNVESLLQSFAILKEKLDIPYKLVITGIQNSRYKETNFTNIIKKITELKLDNYIVYTGYINENDLCLLYNAASLFVYPSLYEGFGLPPLEAMACGCPVVTSNMGSLPEVCGDAVYYIDPYSIQNIMEGMYKVLTDEKLRKFLTNRGLERAKMFSWEKCARETLKVFEEVHNETGNRS